MSKSTVNKNALPVSMGIVYVTTCQAYVVLKIVCDSFLHKWKTILNHVFEFKNSNIDMSINNSFIFLAISSSLLKDLKKELAQPLAILINKSLQNVTVPDP